MAHPPPTHSHIYTYGAASLCGISSAAPSHTPEMQSDVHSQGTEIPVSLYTGISLYRLSIPVSVSLYTGIYQIPK